MGRAVCHMIRDLANSMTGKCELKSLECQVDPQKTRYISGVISRLKLESGKGWLE